MLEPTCWPLETNVCRNCHLILQLVVGVGWLHIPARVGQPWWEAFLRCEHPDPQLRRCCFCSGTAGTFLDGTLKPHVNPRITRGGLPQACVGIGTPGLPPRDEQEAFRDL